MKISEKQIMDLLRFSRDLIPDRFINPGQFDPYEQICDLINEIYNQQSEELQEIK